MKMLKKSTLSLALTAAIASGTFMGVSAPVHAAQIGHDGLGSALVFPYYTVREGYTTQFNLTNTSGKTTAVKVRWREAVNSRDVLDFIVVLSPYDVWTANISDNGEGAQLTTTDNTCTVPNLQNFNNTVPFSSGAYTRLTNGTTVQDSRDTSSAATADLRTLDRTREGYFEVISEGVAIDELQDIAIWAKHGPIDGNGNSTVDNNQGLPNNCEAINTAWATDLGGVESQFDPSENNLKGRAQIINVSTSMGIGFDPLVIEDFNTDENLISESGGSRPSLDDAFTILGDGYQEIESLILRNGVINDYNLENGSQTDWVLTFPTKNFHVDIPYSWNVTSGFPANPDGNLIAPFAERFDHTDGKSCFPVGIELWDREEYAKVPDDSNENVFSPAEPPQGFEGSSLCYEANILSFGGDDANDSDPVGIFGSKVGKVITNSSLPSINNGWAKVDFGEDDQMQEVSLPVIGMRVENRINSINTELNFGFAHDHAYTKQ